MAAVFPPPLISLIFKARTRHDSVDSGRGGHIVLGAFRKADTCNLYRDRCEKDKLDSDWGHATEERARESERGREKGTSEQTTGDMFILSERSSILTRDKSERGLTENSRSEK